MKNMSCQKLISTRQKCLKKCVIKHFFINHPKINLYNNIAKLLKKLITRTNWYKEKN